MFSCIEELLASLNVKILALPAADEAGSIWTKKFEFEKIPDVELVSNLRTAWMGGFHLFADVAKYGRTYNRPVERSGDGKPSVVDMSGKYGTSNAGAESVGVSDCNNVNKEAGNEADMSYLELLKHMSSEGFDDVGLRYVGGRWVWLEFDSMDQVESVKTSKALKEIFLEFQRFCILGRKPILESIESIRVLNPTVKEDQRVIVWMKVWKMRAFWNVDRIDYIGTSITIDEIDSDNDGAIETPMEYPRACSRLRCNFVLERLFS
ncbi:hypothetical protein Tco_0854342 [Tanacetum coccineum]